MLWAPKKLSDGFKSRAEMAKRYADELWARPNKGSYEKQLHDEHLAEFYVYDFLVERSFLNSPNALVAELREHQKRGPVFRSTIFDKETYSRYWKLVVENLINEYENRKM